MTALSMYSGQVENTIRSRAVFGWSTWAVVRPPAWSSWPSAPPQAWRNRLSAEVASAAEPARPTNRLRDIRSAASSRSKADSKDSRGMRGLLGDDEGVLGAPGEVDLVPRADGGALAVLLDDGQLLAARRADEVLQRDAEERGDLDPADRKSVVWGKRVDLGGRG